MSSQELIRQQIEKFLSLMGISAQVAVEDRSGRLVFNIHTEDSSVLIGQYGANLIALQHLIRLVARRQLSPEEQTGLNFIVDVEDYRKSRDEFLIELARQAGERARETKTALVLKPMSGYDRFVIHTKLAEFHDLTTESVGEEPERRVVIKPKI
ncbi:MAG: KH domain-containing protein [Patescibacteria group bacterium]|nr:KH domain-containing protein [Patescibacteria group bacterium]